MNSYDLGVRPDGDMKRAALIVWCVGVRDERLDTAIELLEDFRDLRENPIAMDRSIRSKDQVLVAEGSSRNCPA